MDLEVKLPQQSMSSSNPNVNLHQVKTTEHEAAIARQPLP